MHGMQAAAVEWHDVDRAFTHVIEQLRKARQLSMNIGIGRRLDDSCNSVVVCQVVNQVVHSHVSEPYCEWHSECTHVSSDQQVNYNIKQHKILTTLRLFTWPRKPVLSI